MSMSTNKFWIVVSDLRGPSQYPYRHLTQQSAFDEAQRLVRVNGGKFWVFEAIGASIRQDVITMKFDDRDEIPF
jgi:hypothetical protein